MGLLEQSAGVSISESTIRMVADAGAVDDITAERFIIGTYFVSLLRIWTLMRETSLTFPLGGREEDADAILEAAVALQHAFGGDEVTQHFLAHRMDVLAEMPYADYLRTTEWRDTRIFALRRAGHRCQLCNAASQLQVHHRTYERRGWEHADDLTVVCRPCHARHHEKEA